MKKELEHFKNKFQQGCQRCQKIINLLKMHAAMCLRPGCRVPHCLIQRYVDPTLDPVLFSDRILGFMDKDQFMEFFSCFREKKEVKKQVPKENCFKLRQPVSSKQRSIDGKVVFQVCILIVTYQ
jgi:hypothetical protein